MSSSLGAVSAVRAAGNSDPGLLRDVNEDRFHFDLARGLFMVVDGVGGQAAGGKAADTAISLLRTRLERETGPVAERLREAITASNNEIHRLASLRPEWAGMACVLTVAAVDDGHATVAHVGDTRLYRLRQDRIEKVTRDHSPVGEREDAGELSELEAMNHPRRNEVYRDVGSEPHRTDDPEFIDVQEVPFEPDAALLLCSDGLTDVVDSSAIRRVVAQWAGHPQQVVDALIETANAAGGKDNVTVVYVEGERFATAGAEAARSDQEITRRLASAPRAGQATADRAQRARHGRERDEAGQRGAGRERLVRSALVALLTLVLLLVVFQSVPDVPSVERPAPASAAGNSGRITVLPAQSIAQALQSARPGATILVAPGEYREMLSLKSYVRLVSQVPHGAVLRLPGSAPEAAAAIVATDVQEAVVEGFRIVGDAATPLGTAVVMNGSIVSLSQLKITGATRAAIDVGPSSQATVTASDILDNPGAALAVRGGHATLSHNVFMRNGGGPGSRPFAVEAGSTAAFVANIFQGVGPEGLGSGPEARAALTRDNWFVDARPGRGTRPPARGR
jgi:serine/threonine protein phosphatase PrpC